MTPDGDLDEDLAAKRGDPPAVLPDLLRRALALGLSGFFTTEGAIRRAVNDTLPQDWVDFAVDQSERTRGEVIRGMTQEFGQILEQVDLAEVLDQLLEGRTIEVSAQIRLAPREGEAGGSIKTKTRMDVAKPREDDEPSS